MHAKPQHSCQRHVRRFLSQDGGKSLVAAPTEFDDVVLPRPCIRKRMVQVQQTILCSCEQNLGPLALYPRRAGHEQAVRGQELSEVVSPFGHLIVREAP